VTRHQVIWLTAGTASSGKAVGSESTGTTVGTGSSGTGLSGSTAGTGSPGISGHWVTRHQVIWLASGHRVICKAVGTESPGTGSSGSTAGIESTGLIGSSGWNQFIMLGRGIRPSRGFRPS
ncbi:unnamed protein product, partial [Staurois parvus]